MIDIDKLVCDFLNPEELLGKDGIKRIEDEIRKTQRFDYTYFLIKEALEASLKKQGLEYKDGSLHYIEEEEVKKPEPVNFEDFPREEQLKWYICTKSIPQKDGGFMPLFCEGEPATIEKIFSMCPELKNDVALFVEHFRKVTEDDLPKKPATIKFNEPDIDAMVEEYSDSFSIVPSITKDIKLYHYRQGLEDMYRKLKGDRI